MRSETSNNTFIPFTILNKACKVLLFFLFLTVQLLNAQNKPAPEYQVKAAFLYNFTRFIDWPPVAFSSPDAPFVIGIIGSDPFGSYINELVKGEKIGDHPIIIQRYRDVKDILHCHILFINTKETARIKEVLSTVGHRSILTVSDAATFPRLGGIVRFSKEENKVRLEINIASAKAAQIEISSKLLSLARIFDPRTN